MVLDWTFIFVLFKSSRIVVFLTHTLTHTHSDVTHIKTVRWIRCVSQLPGLISATPTIGMSCELAVWVCKQIVSSLRLTSHMETRSWDLCTGKQSKQPCNDWATSWLLTSIICICCELKASNKQSDVMNNTRVCVINNKVSNNNSSAVRSRRRSSEASGPRRPPSIRIAQRRQEVRD